jgi:hypothetical protein
MAHLKSPGGIKQFGLQPFRRRLHENAALRVGKKSAGAQVWRARRRWQTLLKHSEGLRDLDHNL